MAEGERNPHSEHIATAQRVGRGMGRNVGAQTSGSHRGLEEKAARDKEGAEQGLVEEIPHDALSTYKAMNTRRKIPPAMP